MTTPKEILEAHAAACRDAISRGEPRPLCPPGGYVDADLRDADLRGADLTRADLRGADLRGADLRDADLTCADLTCADLRYTNLSGADLTCAGLTRANLSGADLRYTNLRGADLTRADLRGADLRGADLRGADLRVADIPRAPIPGLAAAVLQQITEHPETWVQAEWHCDTGHCCAGWAVVLAGEVGNAAEQRLGTPAAARLLLGGEGHPFGADDARLVIPWLRERAAATGGEGEVDA